MSFESEIQHFLVIENGYPYKPGERIRLSLKHNLVGRSWELKKPDIDFESLYVSREHALIKWQGQHFEIIDLQSKSWYAG